MRIPSPRPLLLRVADAAAAPACARGFTLIELLVVMTISAILLAVGVPMFNSTIANMRVSEGANSVVAALDLARVEALRRGTTVSVCRVAAADPNACDGAAAGGFAAGDWAAGWMVYADLGGSAVGAFNAGTDERIFLQPQLATGGSTRAQVVSTGAAVNGITFRNDGLRLGPAITLRVTYPQTASGPAVACRDVVIGQAGQVRVERPASC